MDDYHSKKIRLVDGREFASMSDFDDWILHQKEDVGFIEVEDGLFRPETEEEANERRQKNFQEFLENAPYGWDDDKNE